MPDEPIVSVIIPCYNRAAIVRRAIASVRRQTFCDWELIVVDDGSDDQVELEAAVRVDPRIRYIRHLRNRGVSAARNTGIAAARGRFVAFLDSDDEWFPKKLESQVKAVCMVPAPDCVFCVTQTVIVSSSGRYWVRPLRSPAPGRSLAEFLYNDGGFAQSSSCFLSSALARRVPFCEDLSAFEDHVFFAEMEASGAAYLLLPEPLTVWHNENRPDRLSLGKNIAEVEANLRTIREKAGNCFPPRALSALEARTLAVVLWKSAPRKCVSVLLQARRMGALSAAQIAVLLCRNAIPHCIYDLVRWWWERVFNPRASVDWRHMSTLS